MTSKDQFVQLGKVGAALTDTFVVDTHCHIGPCSRMRFIESSADGLIRIMDRLGIDMAAITALSACIDGVITQGNDLVIDAIQRYPNRLKGYMSVNPKYPATASRELRRCLDAGLRLVKVHSGLGIAYNDPSYEMVWEFAAEHRLPILAHTAGRDIETTLESTIARYPQITWSLAHAGIADPPVYVRVAKQYDNVYTDLVYSACPRGMVEYFVAQGLEDKLLWGTDWPFMSAQPQLGKVLFARISPLQKAKILGDNARQILLK